MAATTQNGAEKAVKPEKIDVQHLNSAYVSGGPRCIKRISERVRRVFNSETRRIDVHATQAEVLQLVLRDGNVALVEQGVYKFLPTDQGFSLAAASTGMRIDASGRTPQLTGALAAELAAVCRMAAAGGRIRQLTVGCSGKGQYDVSVV